MGFDYSRLTEITGVTCAGSTHQMYVNPAGTTTYVRQILLHTGDLTGFTAVTVSIFCAPAIAAAVGYAQVTNCMFTRSLSTNETYILDLGVPGLILKNTNDTLRMVHKPYGPPWTSGATANYYVMGGIEV